MKMSEKISHYELEAPFQNKNAGFSRWTYATRSDRKGKEYFLKEFLNPVYPTDKSISESLRQQRIRDCEQYEAEKKSLYETINAASDGNLVRTEEFFRYENHYYIATERVLGQKIPIEVMPAVPFENRVFLCKTVAHAMMKLHQAHVVHADIKQSNVILKQTLNGRLVGKIIDFDASFPESEPPEHAEELEGDQVYLAPEACQFICEEPVTLTTKMDVFALGLLFHQYLTGRLPGFDTAEYDYAFDAVLDGQKLQPDTSLPQEFQEMIRRMTERDPGKRPLMEEVFFDYFDREGSFRNEPEPSRPEPPEPEPPRPDPMGSDHRAPKSPQDWFSSAGDL